MKHNRGSISSYWLLVVVILASLMLVVIGAGLMRSDDRSDTQPSTLTLSDAEIPALPAVDQEGPADLPRIKAALASMAEGIVPVDHGLTREEISAALEKAPRGSDAWCDLLLLAAEEDWTDDQARGFAEFCIN